jgi:uncharacterized protein involved in exopolysaccharide biosynthesis
MERTKWTHDLLEERFAAMDKKSDQLRTDTRSISNDVSRLRQEMYAGFESLRAEMHAGFAALRTEMAADRAQVIALHRQLNAMMGTAIVASLGLLGVLIAKI